MVSRVKRNGQTRSFFFGSPIANAKILNLTLMLKLSWKEWKEVLEISRVKISRPTEAELKGLRLEQWSPWGCDVSRFPWEYDAEETCYIKGGRVIIETEDGEKLEIKAGDLVTFPKGMRCVWDVKEKINKVYTFNQPE